MPILDAVKPFITQGAKLAGGAAQIAGSQAGALINRFSNRGPEPKAGMSDPTLKTKVETTIFRLPAISKNKVSVTVVDGVVTLHGEVRNQAAITTVTNAVRGIPEVKGVESQLHLPKTPAPSTPKAGQRKQTKTTRSTPRTNQRFTREKKVEAAEPSPSELAATGAGRKSAPLGSKETTAATSTTPAAAAKPATPATPAKPKPTGAATTKTGTSTGTATATTTAKEATKAGEVKGDAKAGTVGTATKPSTDNS